MADDRRIVAWPRPIACADAPCEGAQLIGRRLDRIHARKRRDFRPLFLRRGNERTDRTRDRRQRRRLKRHLDPNMRPQPLPRLEFTAVSKIGGKVAAFIAAGCFSLQLKAGAGQRLKHPLPVCRTFAPRTAGAAARRLTDLEIDVLGEALDELPPLRQRRSAGKRWQHTGRVDARDDADRAHHMPVLFHKARASAESGGNLLNEEPVQHARNSDSFRRSRLSGARAA